jgi:hypothetical protein
MTAPCVYNEHPGQTQADAIYFGRGSSCGNRFVIGEHGARDQAIRRFEVRAAT